MALTNEQSIEIMEIILKLIREVNPPRSMVKNIDSNQSIESKNWCKYKSNDVFEKEKKKHSGWQRNTWKL